jgi:hypothetical protein
MQSRTVALLFALALCAARAACAADAACALAAPVKVDGKALSDTELRFTWAVPKAAEACVDSVSYYVVEAASPNQSAESVSVLQSGNMKCGKRVVKSFVATNLKEGTAYKFYIRSVNAAKSASTPYVSAVATTRPIKD